jgi:hypothetical protein
MKPSQTILGLAFAIPITLIFALPSVMKIGEDKVTTTKGNSVNETHVIKQKIDVKKPILIRSEGLLNNSPPVVTDEKDTSVNDLIIEVNRTKEPEQFKNNRPTEYYESVVNNIINGVLDTISADISNVSTSESASGNSISAKISWGADHQKIRDNTEKAFTSTYTFNSTSKGQSNAKIEISQEKNNNNPDIISAYDFLLENSISLILSAGEFEEKITITSGHRDKNKKLIYTILSSNNTGASNLFIEGESNPITINNIPNDSFKLIRKIDLIIELKRLDSGRTFRIILSQHSL